MMPRVMAIKPPQEPIKHSVGKAIIDDRNKSGERYNGSFTRNFGYRRRDIYFVSPAVSERYRSSLRSVTLA